MQLSYNNNQTYHFTRPSRKKRRRKEKTRADLPLTAPTPPQPGSNYPQRPVQDIQYLYLIKILFFLLSTTISDVSKAISIQISAILAAGPEENDKDPIL